MSPFFLGFRLGFTFGACAVVLATLLIANEFNNDLNSQETNEVIDIDYYIDDLEYQ